MTTFVIFCVLLAAVLINKCGLMWGIILSIVVIFVLTNIGFFCETEASEKRSDIMRFKDLGGRDYFIVGKSGKILHKNAYGYAEGDDRRDGDGVFDDTIVQRVHCRKLRD